MPSKARVLDAVLVVVDEQSSLMKVIWEGDRVLARTAFLIRAAILLGVPILSTAQNPERMGPIDERIAELLPGPAISKMTFSCCGAADFRSSLADSGRGQVILAGVETHICVGQTAVDLLGSGMEVIVCPDAVSSRSVERHKLGMERLRDSGALPLHSESVVYEWLETAENPAFRDVLRLVKELS